MDALREQLLAILQPALEAETDPVAAGVIARLIAYININVK